MIARPGIILGAFLISFFVPVVGYFYLGPLVSFLFALGYFGGFAMWLLVRTDVKWSRLRVPYWTAFVIFIFLHKIEENRMNFFEVLGKKITGFSAPEPTPLMILGLLIFPLVTWLSIPFLVKRGHPIGYYLAWTYFTSFGVVELAHFVFPLLTSDPYGYFPGMASATILAPAGIWGIQRLFDFRTRRIGI